MPIKSWIVVLVFLNLSVFAQHKRDKDIYYRNASKISYQSNQFISTLSNFSLDSLEDIRNNNDEFNEYKNSFFKFYSRDHWFKYDYNDFTIKVIPTGNLAVGGGSNSPYMMARGFYIYGSIGKRFKFYSLNEEAQFKLPDANQIYFNDGRYVVPNFGLTKPYGDGLLESTISTGEVSYKINKYFETSFGNAPQFFGDGYHSLFLSDNSYAYPNFKLHADMGRFKYTVLYSQFLNLHSKPEVFGTTFQKKGGVFKYAEISLHKRLSINFFEGVIFQMSDSTGNRGYELSYLNPVIFLRPIEFSLGSPDNAIMGLGFKSNWNSKGVFYGQFVLDDINVAKAIKGKDYYQNKYGIQLGWKNYNFLKKKDWFVQTEFNYVRPFVYNHREIAQNYGHYNQALAHPLGANFYQGFIRSIYRHKRFELVARGELFLKGENYVDSVSYGGNIFVSEYNAIDGNESFGNYTGRGKDAAGYSYRVQMSYIINPFTNLKFTLGYSKKDQNNWSRSSDYIFLGLKTSLSRNYHDLF